MPPWTAANQPICSSENKWADIEKCKELLLVSGGKKCDSCMSERLVSVFGTDSREGFLGTALSWGHNLSKFSVGQ